MKFIAQFIVATAFCLTASVALAVPPPNDNFANALIIVGPQASVSAVVSDATRQSGESRLNGDRTVWWKWTAPASGRVTLDVSHGDFARAFLAVYTGDSLDHLSMVAANNDGLNTSSAEPVIEFQVAQGTTYRIAAAKSGGGAFGALFTVRLDLSLKPNALPGSVVGKSFAEREVLVGSDAMGVGNNVESAQALWWTWTPSANGVITLDTLGSDSDTVLSVYVGTGLDNLLPVRRNNGTSNSTLSYLQFQVGAGLTYQIAVSPAPPPVHSYGNVTLNLRFQPNTELSPVIGTDNFDIDHELVGSVALGQANSAGFTTQPGEPLVESGGSTWWSWTAQNDGAVIVDTSGTDFDTVLHIYTGQFVNGLSFVDENDNYGGNRSSHIRFIAKRLQRYHIAVTGNPGISVRQGNITLTLAQEDAHSDELKAYHAIELELYARGGQKYQLQTSLDFVHWENVGQPFTGTNGFMNWFLPARVFQQRYFRSQKLQE